MTAAAHMAITPGLKVADTPEGRVVRLIWPHGERAYRSGPNGFAVCYGHKGPWLSIHAGDLPDLVWQAMVGAA